MMDFLVEPYSNQSVAQADHKVPILSINESLPNPNLLLARVG
jgi:hypothetical protein